MKTFNVTAMFLSLIALATTHSSAQLLYVSGGGTYAASVVNGSDWVSEGYATLAGAYVGVDWGGGGHYEDAAGHTDFVYNGAANQGSTGLKFQWTTGGDATIEPVGSTLSSTVILGEATSFTGSSGAYLATDVGSGNILEITEVVPGAGSFTLNGVTETATAAGQLVYWLTPDAAITPGGGDGLDFTGSLTAGGSEVGAIGFTVQGTQVASPEPHSWILLIGGITAFLVAMRSFRFRLTK
jgi:hypothetical protein